jgi:hypothetical protein
LHHIGFEKKQLEGEYENQGEFNFFSNHLGKEKEV